MTQLQAITEAIAIIDHMNQAIQEAENNGHYTLIDLRTDGDSFEICYLTNVIFSSENDYTEDDQTLEEYLWGQINDLLEEFSAMYELAKSKSNGQ